MRTWRFGPSLTRRFLTATACLNLSMILTPRWTEVTLTADPSTFTVAVVATRLRWPRTDRSTKSWSMRGKRLNKATPSGSPFRVERWNMKCPHIEGFFPLVEQPSPCSQAQVDELLNSDTVRTHCGDGGQRSPRGCLAISPHDGRECYSSIQ